MHLIAEQTTGAEAAAFIGLVIGVIFLIGVALYVFLETRKAKIMAGQEEALRQLVSRYEQLAENSFDTQQRVAADVSELRSRTSSIEQILRTVE
jgi:hypothetical protein